MVERVETDSPIPDPKFVVNGINEKGEKITYEVSSMYRVNK